MSSRRHTPMIRRLASLLAACALLAQSFGPAAAGSPAGESSVGTVAPAVPRAAKRAPGRRPGGAAYRGGQLLVRFREDATESERAAVAAREGAGRRPLRGGSAVELWTLAQGKEVEPAAATLSARAAVEFAEPNYVITADQLAPFGPRFDERWALNAAPRPGGAAGPNLGAAGAFGANVGSPQAWEAAGGSAHVVVAVVDGGIDFSHRGLARNRWINPSDSADGRDDDGNGLTDDLSGWDWIADTGEAKDPGGHGTFVAGLIVAGDDGRAASAGVGRGASLMSLRVLDERGAGDVASAVEAIDYASAHGAHVINCSWGTDSESRALFEAVARANARGALVVASAGNDARNIDAAPRYPATFDLPNVVSAAATDDLDQLTPWSNWGAWRAHVAAPGNDPAAGAGGGRRAAGGTSAASARVAGVAGLVKGLRPGLSPARVREVLMRGARAVAGLARRVASGGVVSAAGAVAALDALPPGEGGDGKGDDGNEGKTGGAGGNKEGKQDGGPEGAPPATDSAAPLTRGSEGARTPQGVRGRPAANLPDLEVARRHRPTRPQAPRPVPSTLRNCPPHNPRCNGEAAAPGQSQFSSGANSAERVFVAAADGRRSPDLGVARDLTLTDYAREAGGRADTGPAAPFDLPRLYTKAAGLLPALFHAAAAQGGNDADYLSMAVPHPSPSPLLAGRSYHVSVTMKNTGTATWYPANHYRLGAPNPASMSLWRLGRVQLPSNVAPGETVVIPFTITAPTVAGQHPFQWQMIQDGLAWFGEPTENRQITVLAPDFEGAFESADCSEIKGWAWDARRPNAPVEVDIFEQVAGAPDRFLARVVADLHRPGLGKGNNRHGFSFVPPAALRDGAQHEIKVRVANAEFLTGASPVLTGSTKTVTACAALPNATNAPADLAAASASGLPNPQVVLAWAPVPGAVGYRVERSLTKSGPYVAVGSAATAGFTDTGLTNGTSYLYRVCSSDAAGNVCVSPYSNVALGTAFGFTDPTLQAGVTPIRKEHVNELRQTVNSVRAAAELGAAAWGAPVAADDLVRAAHVRDLRLRLTEALAALDILPPAYTDPALVEQQTVVRKAHIEELRLRSTATSGTAASQPAQSNTQAAAARLAPANRAGGGGVDLLSGNFGWGLPLLSLRGRAGLDLGLSLSYNSLVWTRQGSTVHFNADEGYPAPGFRLGFPVIQPQYYDPQANTNFYLLVAPSGARVELRQVAPYEYESTDSTYLRLHDGGGGLLILRAPDGTRMTFFRRGYSHYVSEVRDRNGNRISVGHDPQGRLTSITDTLARVINFNYDANQNLLSITQQRGGQQHTWATFGYGVATVGDVFSGAVTLAGAQEGQPVNVLTQVGLADGSSYRFDYNAHAQVQKISRHSADDHHLAYAAYDFQTPPDDCPRVQARRDWALDWNNGQEAVTTYAPAVEGEWGEAVAPDGTRHREQFDAGQVAWRKGLTTRTETYAGGILQKWTTVGWTQENEALGYRRNPRVTERSIHDKEGNARRTEIDYHPAAYYPGGKDLGLAKDVKEYGAGAQADTVLRRTRFEYNLGAAYVSSNPADTRHLVGLLSETQLFGREGAAEVLLSKVTYSYDETSGGRLAPTSETATPTQHDAAFGAGYAAGRGNVTGVKRWSVKTPFAPGNPESVETQVGYNTTGSVVFTVDAAAHRSELSYADAFVDGAEAARALAFATFAYPTAAEDADGFTRSTRYDYDTGALRQQQTPQPNATTDTPGPVTTTRYDAAGRVERVFNSANGAYARFVYAPGQTWVQSFATIRDASTESYSIQVLDGAGRVYASAADHPGSVGRYRASHTAYDVMGRAARTSNPTEATATWEPAGDDAQTGWLYAQQDYDWMGRPTYSRHADGGMNQEIIYGGCGCAGGEVVTVRDAAGRRSRLQADALGRQVKAEQLNPDGSVYRTTTTTHNARDQVTRLFAQAGASGAGRETLLTYDGHGRLESVKAPIQSSATVYAYNDDDTPRSVTDARGAATIFEYNNGRHLVSKISYGVPAGSNIPDPPDLTLTYDAAGNRLSETEAGTGGGVAYQYDALSRLASEARQFPGLSLTYTLAYQHTAAGTLKQVTDQTAGTSFSYAHDTAGQVTGVSGTGLGGVTTFASDARYRAWGALKSLTYGNNLTFAASYTGRLQISRQEIGNRPPQFGAPVAAATEYQYYADGRLRFADDQVDERFDRAYAYDHAGRLAEAYSGSEARDFVNATQSGPPTGPYRQTHQYDEWDNLTSRYNRFWSLDNTMTATYDAGNRRQGWVYDAQGNVTQDDTVQIVYDAASRNVEATSLEDGRRVAQTFDGAGQLVKLVESQGTTVTQTTYYVRSSALGGQVVAELNAQGQRQKSYVLVGGTVLAEQAGSLVTWRHDFALTGSRGESGTTGSYQQTFEPDPSGMHVGFHDPFLLGGGPGPIDPEIPALMGDFDLPGGRCMYGGIGVDCSGSALGGHGFGGLSTDFWGSRIADLPGFGTNWGSFAELGMGEYVRRLEINREIRRVRHAELPHQTITITVSAGPVFYYEPPEPPSEPQTPMDRLLQKARELNNAPNRNDCKSLVELIRYAGELYRTVIEATNNLALVLTGGDVVRHAVGVALGSDGYRNPQVRFGSVGFRNELRAGPDDNQVEHLMGGLLRGSVQGPKALEKMNSREIGNGAHEVADRNLNAIAVPLGAQIQLHNSDYGSAPGPHTAQFLNSLADTINERVCDPGR